MAGYERKNIISKKARSADVRSWDERTQEWLAMSNNMALTCGVLAAFCFLVPLFSGLFFLIALVAYLAGNSTRVKKLPYRYPVQPADTAKKKKNKEADGIMLLGQINSESPSENFKGIWLNNDWMRRHWLILGATGSGKTETLKGIFFNALCWGSGFFCADGKADNSLPTDGMTMATAFGRVDDVLVLNFLLGGKSPQAVARSRRKRSNGINPFASGDADTLIQMGINLLPKAEGDGKKWQDYAIALWRAVITALVYERDTMGIPISVGRIIDSLSLAECERIYIDGYKQAQAEGDWSYGYNRMKNYLESGLSGYQPDKLLQKHGLSGEAQSPLGGMRQSSQARRAQEQDPEVHLQHGYRTSQLTPALDLLDKTYGYIFASTYPEIDMVDVALQNRILFLLIPSLEKSAQEAESLGKLAIACLRVMMARNLGADVEGTREELRESRATNAEYPYIVALDELGYYFADGIAVMFAQARSLGMSMIALGQDLEMLTRGERSAEAGAMIGNAVLKLFMKIDDSGKTYDLVSKTLGEVHVATQTDYENTKDSGGTPNFRRTQNARIEKDAYVTFTELSEMNEGEAYFNAKGHTEKVKTLYLGPWFDKLNGQEFTLNRFLQIPDVEQEDLQGYTIELPTIKSKNKLHISQKVMASLLDSEGVGAEQIPSNDISNKLKVILSAIDLSGADHDAITRGALSYMVLSNEKVIESNQNVVGASDAVIPHAAELLFDAKDGSSIAQAFDEHGMPDPLALIRKPITEILEPNNRPEPQVVIQAPGLDEQDEEMLEPSAPLPDFSILGDEFTNSDDEEQQAVDEMMNAGYQRNKADQPTPVSKWATEAIIDANAMLSTPRSIDNTAVGLSEMSMEGIKNLEQALGSDDPEAAAKSMQKIASAQITPNTLGVDKPLDEDEIEDFFSNL